MKSIKITILFGFTFALLLGCKKTSDPVDPVSESTPANVAPVSTPTVELENMSAANGMTAALHAMVLYNDSLTHAQHNKHHHDAMFHHHDSVYVHHHANYHHGDTLHHHAGWHHTITHHDQHDSIVVAHHHITH